MSTGKIKNFLIGASVITMAILLDIVFSFSNARAQTLLSPMAWWDFNDESSVLQGTIVDKMGNYNSIIYGDIDKGPKWIGDGYVGGAINFNCSGNGGTVTDCFIRRASLPEASNYTLLFRMKVGDVSAITGSRTIFQSYNEHANINGGLLSNNTEANKVTTAYDVNWPVDNDNAWHHYAFVWGENGHYYYKDGIQIGYAAGNNEKVKSYEINFGASTMNGPDIQLDEIKVYNYALENSQITEEYNNNKLLPPICSSWTYSDWGVCTENQQIRTILSSIPDGCVGGIPVLTQTCTSTCSSWTYSEWNVCTENQQTRTVLSSTPIGCTGGSPVLTQACTSTPDPVPTSTCSSWTYSEWSVCTENQQTRTVLSSTPIGCAGGSPVLSQTCVSGPQITSLSPSAVYPGLKVTMNGKNFGSFGTYGSYCPSCSIQVNEISVSPTYNSKYIYEWSDTSISFNMPSNAKDGFITITDKNGVKSNQFAFTLSPDPTAPVINSISPDTITPGETMITIYGANFGNSYSSYDNQICFNEYCISSFYLSEYVSKWSDTEIQIRTPSYIGEGSGNISVKAYFASTKKYDFVKSPIYKVKKIPTIALYYPTMLQGNSYEFSGKNFGKTQGKVVLNGIEAEILSWSDTGVTFKVPSKASSGQIYIENSDSVQSSPIDITILKKYSNDEYSFIQWYLENLNIDKAWESTEGSSNVVVAVIDSGVDIDHEDLKDAIWKNKNEIANNGIDDDSNGYIDDIYGWDFVLKSNSTGINEGHGTGVASLIAAKKDNGIGIAGVATGVKIMALNISTIEDGTIISVDAANEAIKYAVDNGADIINLSFGGLGNSILYDAALKYAYENNVLVVAAAGNENANLDDNSYAPACVDLKHNAVIGVASIDIGNVKSSFSNYGKSCVDLAAPGEYIVIAVPSVLGNYSIGNGTSFAAPIVTGIAALIKSKNPDWNIEEIKKVLLDTSTNISDDNPLYTDEMGMGLPNAYLALTASRPTVSYEYNPDSKLILKETGLTIEIEEPDLKPIEKLGPIENDSSEEGIIKNEDLIQSSFPDIQGNKNEKAINYLKNKGIVKGHSDGTFKPDNTLNRAELLKIVVLAKYPEPSSDFNKKCFTDVENGAWYAPYICFAKENKIVQGYANGTFKPSQQINYVEALKITLETMDYSPSETTKTWYQAYLDKASAMMIGLDLAPDKNITRGEMAQLIMSVMEY